MGNVLGYRALPSCLSLPLRLFTRPYLKQDVKQGDGMPHLPDAPLPKYRCQDTLLKLRARNIALTILHLVDRRLAQFGVYSSPNDRLPFWPTAATTPA